MIPKKIHYCWFGRNPLNKTAIKCIESWKKYNPDFEIHEWNEDNYDVYKISYSSQAYHAKKYAFVSDFARFDILFNEGGIYLDVDVELLKPLDPLLENDAYIGFEEEKYVNPGLGFGCISGHPLIGEIIKNYKKRDFLKSDGKYDYTTIVHTVSDILYSKGLINNNQLQTIENCTIYPKDFFQPIDMNTQKLIITNNTISIHHYASSWYPTHRKILQRLAKLAGPKVKNLVRKIIKRKW